MFSIYHLRIAGSLVALFSFLLGRARCGNWEQCCGVTNGKGGAVIWHLPWHMTSHFRDAFSIGTNFSIASSFFFSGCNQLCEQDPKLYSQLTDTYKHGIQ